MLNKYLLSVDWLQLNCRSKQSDFLQSGKYLTVEPTDLFTRAWEEILQVNAITVDRYKQSVATVARKPKLKAIDPQTMLLKFDNYFLYQGGLKGQVIRVLDDLGLKVHSISRIDLSLDFQVFDNGLHPERLIKKFIECKFLKKGRGKFKLIGNHNTTVQHEYIRWGSRESVVSYYLYNKSRELKEEKMKPWIQDKWLEAGLLNDSDVWRLEFSIKTGGECVTADDSETNMMLFPDILDPVYTLDLFNALRRKYFVFYHYK